MIRGFLSLQPCAIHRSRPSFAGQYKLQAMEDTDRVARAKTLGKCFEWANASVFQRGTGTCKMGGRVAVGEPAPIQIVFQNKSGHPVQVTNEFWVCPRLCKTFTARYAGWMTIYRKSCQTWRLYVTRKFPVLEPLLLFNLCLSKIGICLRTNAWHHLRRTLIIAQIPTLDTAGP